MRSSDHDQLSSNAGRKAASFCGASGFRGRRFRWRSDHVPPAGLKLRRSIQLWREAGLNTSSTIRVHKLTVLAKDEVVRRLGALQAPDQCDLMAALRRAFSL